MIEELNKEIKVIEFIYLRMIEVHKENKHVDYMINLKKYLDKLKTQKKRYEEFTSKRSFSYFTDKNKKDITPITDRWMFSFNKNKDITECRPLVESDTIKKVKIKWEAIKEIIKISLFFVCFTAIVIRMV